MDQSKVDSETLSHPITEVTSSLNPECSLLSEGATISASISLPQHQQLPSKTENDDLRRRFLESLKVVGTVLYRSEKVSTKCKESLSEFESIAGSGDGAEISEEQFQRALKDIEACIALINSEEKTDNELAGEEEMREAERARDVSSNCSMEICHSDKLSSVDSGATGNGAVSGNGAVASNGARAGNGPVGSEAQGTATDKKAAKAMKRDMDQILKAVNSLDSPEEKISTLCKKYTELYDEHRQLKTKLKQGQRQLATIIKEKDQLQTEHSKATLAKVKLENLCRELHRHNEQIKQESVSRSKEEEDKRKEVTGKFQSSITEIQVQMNDHYAKNTQLREENKDLTLKLKSLIEQYEAREQHIEKVLKQKDLEQQLVDAKLAQANLQVGAEKERYLVEKQQLVENAIEAQKKIALLEAQEKQLKAQVNLYTDKYDEFQQTLSKSNEVFQSFKAEMEKMTKKIKSLEKETILWKTRWETSNKAFLEMTEEKAKNDKEKASLKKKLEKLESLCRALQEERRQGSGAGSKPNVASAVASVDEAPSVRELLKVADKEFLPTKTPPNTPDASRTSPITVQSDLGGVVQQATVAVTLATATGNSSVGGVQSEAAVNHNCEGGGVSADDLSEGSDEACEAAGSASANETGQSEASASVMAPPTILGTEPGEGGENATKEVVS